MRIASRARGWTAVVGLACLVVSCDRDITIGPDRDTSGNSWGRNVSRQFKKKELNALFGAMNSAETKSEIRRLACGSPSKEYVFSVTLWEENSTRERIVRLQMTPRLYKEDGCLENAANYVFQRKVKNIDSGPPIDYGYRDPLTGKHLDTSHIEPYFANELCSCAEVHGTGTQSKVPQ